MSYLQSALRLAKFGFYVFPVAPLQPGSRKVPLFEGWQKIATRKPENIRRMWTDPVMGMEHPWAIGISTSKFGDEGECLIVIDSDNKDGKDGDGEIVKMEFEGKAFPPTFEQLTPTAGRHYAYRSRVGVGNSVCRLAPGVDVRSIGGFIVGAGSDLGGESYSANWQSVAEAPEWLVKDLGADSPTDLSLHPSVVQETFQYNPDYSARRAEHYLLKDAPLALEGQGGNQTTYRVVGWLKDLGIDALTAYELLLDKWNDRCEPPWSPDELVKIVDNAYRYGKRGVGSAAPEADFPPENDATVSEAIVPKTVSPTDPIEKFNKEYAFIIVGSSHHVLHETCDEKGRPVINHLKELTFHRKHAAETLSVGNGKTEALSKLWMMSPRRRSFRGLCFRPGLKTPPGYYNLFRGFSVEPIGPDETPTAQAQEAFDRFLEHALENVCNGDQTHFKWLMNYFAHMFQMPSEKPLTALVFRGEKGVGKNALIDRLAFLMGAHALKTSKKRYLLSNFNAHLQNLLLFTLDEAFWSGDKEAEGVLKDLITGTEHVIEHKGAETFVVDNCTRIVILGNEDWLVPATQDERRFAVFDVGTGRKQDRKYFHEMRIGMEKGGYRLLLRYLLDYPLSENDVDHAPDTKGLLDQKVKSLSNLHRWWFECLLAGEIVDSEFGHGEWVENVPVKSFVGAFTRYVSDNGLGKRIPSVSSIGIGMRKVLPSMTKRQIRDGTDRVRAYSVPDLIQCRTEWDIAMGRAYDWENG